jgi:hypothetical protein
MIVVTSAMRNFEVKDSEEVLKVFKALGFNESNVYNNHLVIAGQEKALTNDLIFLDGGKPVAVLNNDDFTYYNLEGEQIEFKADKQQQMYWFEYLQEKLLDDKQIAAIVEISCDKLRYADSYTVVVSKKEVCHSSTSEFILNTAKRLEK